MLSDYLVPRYGNNHLFLSISLVALHFCVGIKRRKDLHFFSLQIKLSVILANYTVVD